MHSFLDGIFCFVYLLIGHFVGRSVNSLEAVQRLVYLSLLQLACKQQGFQLGFWRLVHRLHYQNGQQYILYILDTDHLFHYT